MGPCALLTALTITDLAVVKHLDIEFSAGLTVLTGETGAGKSILIGALGLALGDRADSSMVRSGCEKASVTACLDVSKISSLRALFEDNDLDYQDECILRRVVNADGRSRAYCNTTPIPIQLLKKIGEYVVDIHAQHAQQSLLRKAAQMELLDGFGQLDEERVKVADNARAWKNLRNERQALTNGIDNVGTRIDFLKYQIEEIEKLEISADSLQQLNSEHKRIANGAKMIDSCERALHAVTESPQNARQLVTEANNALREIVGIDKQTESITEALDQAQINLEEAARELAYFQQTLEVDPLRLEQLEQRMQTIQDLARKHGCKSEELPARLSALKDELDSIGQRESKILEIESALETSLGNYRKHAKKLHEKRQNAADKLGAEVTRRIRELGIPHGEFSIDLDYDDTKQPNASGDNEVEYLVTANPDQAMQPIKKVASGGELSRISLAIQVATSRASAIPTLVFDEVDTGIGGPTAATVSRYLQTLAEQRQILSITHLAQVASSGDHHLFVGKSVAKGSTETMLTILTEEQRIKEVARMLGGERLTENSLAHARELLSA
ncbi:MAG: DNA repair protein RecN [Pseudomonadota bacterium]